jgi:proton glutamate symport protein
MVDLIMLSASYGLLALLATLVVESTSIDLFKALGWYVLTVVLGLAIMIGIYIL